MDETAWTQFQTSSFRLDGANEAMSELKVEFIAH
jgi:hypothetical protein